jgi:hypothetical protein
MSTEKVTRQRFALIVGEGLVRAVGEITGLSVHGDRVALEGTAIGEGHPVHDAYIGKPDLVATGSQNSVGYCDLPEEHSFVFTPGGCGDTTDRDFLPGHEVRAIQARVRAHFGGSALKFIQWIGTTVAASHPAREPA